MEVFSSVANTFAPNYISVQERLKVLNTAYNPLVHLAYVGDEAIQLNITDRLQTSVYRSNNKVCSIRYDVNIIPSIDPQGNNAA